MTAATEVAAAARSTAAAIEFDDFGLAFRTAGGERPIFAGVTLSIPRGQFLLLVGESGSGKSTLLRLLTGLWETRERAPRRRGTVRVLGDSLGSRYPRGLRGRVQAVLQDEGLLDELSPRANVELALRVAGRSPRLALGLLAQAGLRQPPAEVAALSGGMRKRAAVARALAGEPELLLFDEPTAGLDAASARSIAELIAATHAAAGGRRTTLVITHDLRAFEGLTDGHVRIDPRARNLSMVAAGADDRRPVPDSSGKPTGSLVAAPELAGPDLEGLHRLVREAADYAHNLGHAILRLPPLFPMSAMRTTARFVVEAVLFVAVGSATVGGLATFFALRNNPLEGAFTTAVITGSGKVLVAVLIPLLAGFFFTARICAGAAARLGTMKRTGQIDALELLGVRPEDYLLNPLVWGASIAMPLVTLAGVMMATVASYAACKMSLNISDFGWARAYTMELERVDLRFMVAKTLLSGFLVAVTTYHLATGPKRSGRDVGRSVNNSIVVGMFLVLAVHAVATLLQFV